MTKRISSPCVIVPIIILGIIFLITTSSPAQGTSASSEQEKIARDLSAHLQVLKLCDEGKSQVANKNSRMALEKRYQDYLKKLDLKKKSRAISDKYYSEYNSAQKAYDEAHEEFVILSDKCEKAKEVTKKDWKNIQSCIDAAYLYEKVVKPSKDRSDEREKVWSNKLMSYLADSTASDSAYGAYLTDVRNIASIFVLEEYIYAYSAKKPLLYERAEKGSASPDQLKDVIEEICRPYKSKTQDLIKRVIAIVDSYIKACKPGDADIFVGSLPEFDGRKELQKGIRDVRLREDVSEVNYEEGRSLYRKGRVEEMKGNVSQAQDLYRKAIAKMQEGRKLTKCDSRVKQFDKAIGQINSRLAQKGTTNIGNCDVPKDFAAQKRALHARIKKGNTFREDGGGQWNPTFVMRAGYSVGSETLKATALALNAMSNLVGGYEQCYAKFWSFMEGEFVQLTKARDAAYKKSWAEGQRLNGILGKRKAEAASALNTCVIDSDNTFKAAMKKAQELCK